jgi:hypothetical protein
MADLFISYNQADRDWANWIAWTLEGAGYTVIIQAWIGRLKLLKRPNVCALFRVPVFITTEQCIECQEAETRCGLRWALLTSLPDDPSVNAGPFGSPVQPLTIVTIVEKLRTSAPLSGADHQNPITPYNENRGPSVPAYSDVQSSFDQVTLP